MKAILAFMILIQTALVCAQPWVPNVIWERDGANDSSYYGRRILPLGDQNDDGYSDWAVSGGTAPWGTPTDPVVEFFHGGATPDTNPYRTFRPAQDGSECCLAGRSAGDVNGDGYVDCMTFVVKLIPGYAVEMRLYFGGPQADDSVDLWMRRPLEFGWIPLNGDFNGDGYDDIWFGDWDNHVGNILFGGAQPDTVEDWTILDQPPGTTYFVASADVNGDGLTDILAASYHSPGALHVFLGNTSPDTLVDQVLPGSTFSTVDIGNVSDLNADGTEDLFVPLRVHYGRFPLSATPDYLVDVACLGNELRPTALGDINGDGYADFATTSYDCQNWTGGAAQIWLGGPWINPEPRIVIWGDTQPTWIVGVRHVIGLGDVNGDGINDFGLGGNHEFLDTRGRAVVISGDTTLHLGIDVQRPEIAQQLEVQVYPNPFNSSATIEVILPRFAREVAIEFYNVVGQVVFESSVSATAGRVRYRFDSEINGAPLPTGLYFLHVSAAGAQKIQKVMVLR